ncbi:MAG: hypothetical protein LPJ89_03320, partial [Hymenobacteraceae bacterium]|nr:hypothetical protein [Hymenobacteraceae bacterium]
IFIELYGYLKFIHASQKICSGSSTAFLIKQILISPFQAFPTGPALVIITCNIFYRNNSSKIVI